jgi:hypothetical protein
MIDNAKDFTDYINKIRLQNKNKWYFIEVEVNNKIIQIKGYDTWIQIFKINDDRINYSSPMDFKVAEFKNYLTDIYNRKLSGKE